MDDPAPRPTGRRRGGRGAPTGPEAAATASAPAPVAARPQRPTARVVVERAAAVLLLVALGWLVAQALFAVALLVGALGVALVLTALLQPVVRGLRRRLPAALAAALTTLLLLGGLALLAFLIATRVSAQLDQIPSVLTFAVERARTWLVQGPLALDPTQVRELRNVVVDRLSAVTPSPVSGAVTALRLLGAAAIVVFALFFLLKDGARMWRWALDWTPERWRGAADTAGTAAWRTLAAWVRGVLVVATVDAVGIGLALLVLGVPLWLSLTVLTFFGALVPVLGATVAGAAAVIVTLVLEGGRDAFLVLLVVLLVQQLEGNVLHPLIMGRALRLHPLAVLAAVTAGALLLGVVGALVAVPVTAVAYSVAAALRGRKDGHPDGRTDRAPALVGDSGDRHALD